jgi:hypothetical protein
MTTYALDFPLGRPLIPAAAVRRWRRLPPGSRPLVGPGERVQPEQAIAELPGGASLLAGLGGRVVEVSPAGGIQLEGVATVVAGLLGLGGGAAGPLTFLPPGESAAVLPIPPGGIIVHPQRVPLTLLQRAAAGGAAGLVAASAAAHELEAFARADLTAVLDGLVPGIERFPLPLLLTEGVGEAPMDPSVLQTLTACAGQVALLFGHTIPRWNLRPELLIAPPANAVTMALPADCALVPGAQARIAAGALRGARGELAHVFTAQPPDPLGRHTPSAQLRLQDGRLVVVPLANLDRVG